MQHQLDADEGADDPEAFIQVDDPVQQPGQQRIQLPEPHQRERVAGQDQVGVGGDAENGRDRVDGEQHIGQPDRHDHQQHRGDHQPPGPPRDRPVAVILPGWQQMPLQPRHQPGVRFWLATLSAGNQADRGPHQDGAQRVEQPAETVQRRRPGHDEERPEHQRQPDAKQQDAMLTVSRYREPADDHVEDEQVVQAQAVLGEIASVELARRHPASREPDGEPEDHRQRHVDRNPADGAAYGERSAAGPASQHDLRDHDRDQSRRRHLPDPCRDHH